MALALQTWLNRVNGQRIDMDGNYPAKDPYQCWDLMAHYMSVAHDVPLAHTFTNFGGRAPHAGYACNVFHNAANVGSITAKFTIVDASVAARAGDIAFWEKGGAFAGSHVAIVVRDNGSTLYCMSQNKGPAWDAAAYETLTKRTLLGYLRPKSDKNSAPVADRPAHDLKGFLMALSDSRQEEVANKVDLIFKALIKQPSTGGMYYMTDAIVDVIRGDTVQGRLENIQSRLIAKKPDGSSWGFDYLPAILNNIGTLFGLVGKQQTVKAEVDVAALAAQLREGLGDALADELATRLTKK